MMTREEAIKLLKQYQGYDPMFPDGETLKHAFDLTDETVDTLLTALRPVSREQVEKVFPGCEMCREKKEVKSDNFCGAATMRIVGDSIDLRGNEKKIKFFGHIYAPSFSVKFCPFCGRPLTDEAMQMVMERMDKCINLT